MRLSLLLLLTLLLLGSCENDSNNTSDQNTDLNLSDNIEVYNENSIDNSLTFGMIKGGDKAFLTTKTGEKLHEWTFTDNLGNDLEILSNGQLLGIFKSQQPSISFGGYGGIVKLINTDGSIAWEYEYSSDDYISHHDVEMLPNGNIIFLVWESIDELTAEQNGTVANGALYPETLIEINPSTNQVVWQWRSWDHIVQDMDPSLPNYGMVSENPQRININYNASTNGDIMHANGIDYDSDKDIIYLSVNFYNEIWVIDHSTTIAEAASHSGGQYGKGGDLLYRFGNPLAYDNNEGEVYFDSNHFPNLLEDNEPGHGNLLVYVNGKSTELSKVLELDIPENFVMQPNVDNEPVIVWQFEDSDFYARIISGAVRLKNGNTLICEGDYGFWEVTSDNEVVWKYNGFGDEYWRAYAYELDDPRLAPYLNN